MNADQLVRLAADARNRAHAPYSKYYVGAALLGKSGEVYSGCNVENASYGLTNCAERTALFSAVAAGEKQFDAIAIVAGGQPVPYPCGACRQVLAEFCGPELPVYVASAENLGSFQHVTLGALLPHTFKLKG